MLERTTSAYEQQREAARGAALGENELGEDSWREESSAPRRKDEGGERAESAEQARERRRADRRDEDEGDDGGGKSGEQFGGRAPSLGATAAAGEQPPSLASRAILNIVDLERIVSAARSQMTPDGRREITLELTRSVLDGLRIKLTQNGDGRIEAELIASTERAKLQLDERTADLAALMRSRGVNLSGLKTSLDAQARSGGDADANRQSSGQLPGERVRAASARPAVAAVNDADDGRASVVETNSGEAGATYRA